MHDQTCGEPQRAFCNSVNTDVNFHLLQLQFLTDVGFVFLAIRLEPFYTVVILLQEQWSW